MCSVPDAAEQLSICFLAAMVAATVTNVVTVAICKCLQMVF